MPHECAQEELNKSQRTNTVEFGYQENENTDLPINVFCRALSKLFFKKNAVHKALTNFTIKSALLQDWKLDATRFSSKRTCILPPHVHVQQC